MTTEQKFAVIYDLDGLSEGEIAIYKQKVAVHFGLDADANLFDVIWIVDPNTGFKRRQLYARRGTTDILRDLRGISVASMVQHDGPGYVSFTATGTNKDGRQEVAVGAHSTAGLQGEKLAAAVSTAETRAGRRLTLKFVGLGILDDSEVHDNVEVKSDASQLALVGNAVVAGFAPVFSPSVSPNAAPGRELPPAEKPVERAKRTPKPQAAPLDDVTAQAQAEAAELSRKAYEDWQAQTRAQAAEALKARPEKGFPGIDPVSEPPTTVSREKPKRTRRKKNTVDIASPGQTPVEIPVQPVEKPAAVPVQVETAAPPQANPAVPARANYAGVPHEALTPPTAPIPASVVDFPGKPTKEQEEQYRAQLREYSNIILPAEGGMTPSAGIGGPSAKLRAFTEHWVGKTTQLMTADEWNQFFEALANFRKVNGAKNLVKYINDSLGVS